MDNAAGPRYGITVRLAHCSDLHLLSLDGTRLLDFANKRWIGGLNLLTSRSRHHHTEAFEDMVADFATAGIDHVVCTGDVTNLGLEPEFRFARERFDRIAIGPQEVTVLPGNHDAYVAKGAVHFAEVFGTYFTTDAAWAWPAGEPGDLEAAWPVVRVRDGVAVIGLSTSLQTPWFTAWGQIGERQLARLRQVLADPRLAGVARVVAIHHPPAGVRATSRIRGLRDRVAFAQVLAEVGADVVLHGHEHENLVAELLGPEGARIPVLGVASGTYHASRPERTARYRVFEVEQGRVVRHHLRVWHRDRRCFEDDLPEGGSLAASA
jgi:3',5'-cyclic AMP phosphodiesterase CpdA